MKKTILALALAVLMCTPIFAAQAGKVSTSSLPLNVRSAPGGRVITSLAKGSNVTLISKSGSWWYARYGENAYGYLSAAYITPLGGEELTVTLSSGSLNVRTGGGMAYRVIDTFTTVKGSSVSPKATAGAVCSTTEARSVTYPRPTFQAALRSTLP
ncbi:MAG: SH3 domain-containing protein [Clostridia bacterium]|nr:SH3 domain-containing protein [Clostridia bacterium]